jgi:hypothetical protein
MVGVLILFWLPSIEKNAGNQDPGDTSAIAFVFFGISALLALVYFCLRTQIRLCAQLFKVSAASLHDNWALIPLKARSRSFALFPLCSSCLQPPRQQHYQPPPPPPLLPPPPPPH